MSLLSKFKEKKLRKQFESHYEVALSSEFKIENSHHAVYPGRFILRFPQWKYAKADGTKDHRKKEKANDDRHCVIFFRTCHVSSIIL